MTATINYVLKKLKKLIENLIKKMFYFIYPHPHPLASVSFKLFKNKNVRISNEQNIKAIFIFWKFY